MFKCELCEKELTTKTSLQLHMQLHKGTKEFACKTCGKAFARKDYLKDHLPGCSGDKPFICRICNKSFGRKDTRRKHIRKVHRKKGEKTDDNDAAAILEMESDDETSSYDNYFYDGEGSKDVEERDLEVAQDRFGCAFCPEIFLDVHALQLHFVEMHCDGIQGCSS